MSHLVRLGIIGALGKMGQQIFKAAHLEKKCTLASAFVRKGSPDHPLFENDLEVVFQKSDVIIDFSSKELFDSLIEAALKYKKPLVIGTTGLLEKQQEKLRQAAMTIPIFFSANFSVGIALMEQMCSWVSAHLTDCHIEMVETHHIHKKDQPSGTALSLASCCGQEGAVAIHSIRRDEVIGEHEVFFKTPQEVITIKHEALDRSVFAKGAIEAALFIQKQNKGLFTMKNLFGSFL